MYSLLRSTLAKAGLLARSEHQWWAVRMRGENLQLSDGENVGFYTTRPVQAANSQEAAHIALHAVGKELTQHAVGQLNGPRVEVYDVLAVSRRRASKIPRTGLAFYPQEK